MFKILHNKSLLKLNCKKQERAVHQEEVTLETKPEPGEVGGGGRLLRLQGRRGRHREEEGH